MKLSILIPVKFGTSLHPVVMEGLTANLFKTEETSIFIRESPKRFPGELLCSIVSRARNALIPLACGDYTLLLDQDVVIAPYTISGGIRYLENRSEVGVVSFRYLQDKGDCHVTFGASLWRTEVIKSVRFRGDKDFCECLHMRSEIENRMALKVVYHPSIIAAHNKEYAS